MNDDPVTQALKPALGTWEVFVAGVALVVAASTLVSDFTGFFTLGLGFAIALVLGFGINLLLAMSAADLSVGYPRAGALYDYARAIFRAPLGEALGIFLALAFFLMFPLVAAGEASAGAIALQRLLGLDAPLSVCVALLTALAVIPNLFGVRTAAWAGAALLLTMLGIRWAFGVAGFAHDDWSWQHLTEPSAPMSLWGQGGILAAGLALAVWSFIGIEFACSLAEEVRTPRRAMPRGMILGLVVILVTSLVMGLGVTGIQPLEAWQAMVDGQRGCGGDCPQLAAAWVLFGGPGEQLMAVGSVAATLGSLMVAFAVMPRILYSIARDGHFGPLSRPLAAVGPRSGEPLAAIGVTFALYLGPVMFSTDVVDWIYSAAYVWVLLYLAFHGLALANRRLHPHRITAFGRWYTPLTVVGMGATALGLYYAFAGSHSRYGLGALAVLGVAAALTAAARWRPAAAPALAAQADYD